jgi:hypothetical protein
MVDKQYQVAAISMLGMTTRLGYVVRHLEIVFAVKTLNQISPTICKR